MPDIIDKRTPYIQWIDGDTSDTEFFNIITGEMVEHDLAFQEAEAAYKTVRAEMEHVMSVLEGKLSEGEFRDYKDRLELRGYTYQNTKPHERRTVKVGDLMKLKPRITAADPALWEAVMRCVSFSPVAGGVRIGHVKKEG